MFTEFITATGTMLVFTLGLVVLIKLNPPKRFNPVKALGLTPGLYQNKTTGSLIEVKAFNGIIATVSNKSGQFTMRYDILDREYAFVGFID